MLVLLGDINLWSLDDDINIKDTDFGAFKWVLLVFTIMELILLVYHTNFSKRICLQYFESCTFKQTHVTYCVLRIVKFLQTDFSNDFSKIYLPGMVRFRYHEKRIDGLYEEGKRAYCQKRGMVSVLQNKKGNKLKDGIKYLEVIVCRCFVENVCVIIIFIFYLIGIWAEVFLTSNADYNYMYNKLFIKNL